MPTIEIVSVNASKLNLKQSDFNIAIIEENKLQGHRGLFNDLLADKRGVMVHIGNPEFKNNKDEMFFAGMIVDWGFESNEIEIPNFILNETGGNQEFKFKFLPDYQIGPETVECKEFGPQKFWRIYDTAGLNWNTLYEIKND